MWRKNTRFLSYLQLTGQLRSLKRAQCCCMERCARTQLHTSTTQGHQHQDEANQRSRSHLTTLLTALGVSFTTYMLWNERRRLYAAESPKSNKNSSKTPAQEQTSVNQSKDAGTERVQSGQNEETQSNNNASVENKEQTDEIDWSLLPDIPSHVPYLLIGSGVASLEAFKAIKTKDIKAKVLMIGDEEYSPYWRPPLSKHFWFDENVDAYQDFQYTNMRGKKSSIFLSEGLYMDPKKLPYSDRGGLALLKNTKVVKLDSVNKKVTLDNGSVISFDKCLIATGGHPKNDQVLDRSGKDVKDRLTLFRNYNDLWKLCEVCKSAKSIAVIGGGFLGTELAVGIQARGESRGIKVHQLFPETGNMAKVLPEFLSKWTTDRLQKVGVDIKPNTSIKSAVYENGKVKLGLRDGTYLIVDHLVVAVGIEPNTELAASGNLELDEKIGGFKVNTELQARTDIWAAGDCASFYDVKLGRRRVEHYDHAAITGRMAGFNMAGENRPYEHQSIFWSTIAGVTDYEAVGMIDSKLQTYSVFRKSYSPEKKDDDGDKAEKKSKDEGGTAKPKSSEPKKSKPKPADKTTDKEVLVDDYNHGVIFYLRDDEVVGVVLWNIGGFLGYPSRIDIARQVIADGAKGKDLTEVAKLFNVYVD